MFDKLLRVQILKGDFFLAWKWLLGYLRLLESLRDLFSHYR